MNATPQPAHEATRHLAQLMQSEAADRMFYIQCGDSMAPEIPEGAIVIVDTSITWCAKSGGLYLLNFDGKEGTAIPPSQGIRRLSKQDMRDEYRVSCANPHYLNHLSNGEDLSVAGMVIGSIHCVTH